MTDITLYVQLDEFKSTQDFDSDDMDDDALVALAAASRAVETLTGRLRFYLPDDSNDETRWYTADGPTVVKVDDLAAVTSVALDLDDDGVYERELQTSEYLATPLNALADGRSWDYLNVRQSRCRFPSQVGGVQVTGRFGWATTPPGVAAATSIIAEQVFKRLRENPFPVLQVGVDAVAIRIGSYDDQVVKILRSLDRRPRFA